MASSDADPVGRVLEASGLVLERARLLGSRRPVVVAVSGGADSLCMLDVMVTLLERAKRRVVVGHIDHKLRPDSATDAEHVRAAAKEYGVQCAIMDVDVPALADADRRGIEEAARIGRYRALRDLAARSGAVAVVTGHTRDDSVETVVMHLLRGSGQHGLSGIAEDEQLELDARQATSWKRGHSFAALRTGSGRPGSAARMAALPGVRLVRPMLGVRRADTTAYCQARGIGWLTDPTNADPRMLRNRVRGHLLPVLRTYNPAVDETVDRLALVVRDEDTYLDDLTEQRYRRLVWTDAGLAQIGLPDWTRQPRALQRRLVRRIAQHGGHQEIGFEAVERALAVGKEDGPPRAELGGGLVVERRAGTLIFDSSTRVTDE